MPGDSFARRSRATAHRFSGMLVQRLAPAPGTLVCIFASLFLGGTRKGNSMLDEVTIDVSIAACISPTFLATTHDAPPLHLSFTAFLAAVASGKCLGSIRFSAVRCALLGTRSRFIRPEAPNGGEQPNHEVMALKHLGVAVVHPRAGVHPEQRPREYRLVLPASCQYPFPAPAERHG